MTDTIDKLYPIEWDVPKHELMANQIPQPVCYTLSNMVALFENYFLSFFGKDYFKTIRMKTEVSFASALKNMTHTPDKPMLLIDPSDISIVEETIFYNNLMGRLNPYDSRDPLASAMYQSVPYFDDGTIVMSYRSNRYKVRFDIMMVESTFANMLNLNNMLVMGIRHRSKFSIERTLLVSIPTEHIKNLAKFKQMSYRSDVFLKHLNANSTYPIIRRIYGSGHLMFFMLYPTKIAVEVPDIPSKDGFNRDGMVEGAHRVTDIFSFDAEFPCENLIIFPQTLSAEVIPVEPGPQDLLYISPYLSPDPIYTMGTYTLINSIDATASPEECSFNIFEVIELPKDTLSVVTDYIKASPISNIISIRCTINGDAVATFTLSNEGVFQITNPDIRNVYNIAVYLNYELVNDIKIQLNTNKIGTVVLG